MPQVQLLVGGLLLVSVLVLFAERFRLPRALVLLLGGLALGFVPGTPDVQIDPDVIFLVFLPPILYAAGFDFASEDIQGSVRAIGLLAIGLVLATVGGVAVVAHAVMDIAWAPAFVLGAIVAPTDPVVATTVIRRLGAPGRITTILEGESLANDGTGLTAFKVAAGAVGGGFSFGGGVLDFLWILSAGSAIGAVAGWVSTEARRRLEQPHIEITLALVTSYGAFFLADEAGVSGILASVFAGVVVGRRALDVGSPETRLQSYGFWEVTVFIAESLLFVLIGVVFQHVLQDLDAPAVQLIGEAGLLLVVVVALRAAWMFTVPFAVGAVDPRIERGRAAESQGELAALSLGGVRGAITVAAALSIPKMASGAAFPDRSLLIFLAYTTVLGTLMLTVLSLPAVMTRTGLMESGEHRQRAAQARLRVAHAALERAEQLSREGDFPEEALRRAREAYEMRIVRVEADADGGQAPGHDLGTAYREIRRELIRASRAALADLRSERRAPGETLREIERELDLEQARLEG